MREGEALIEIVSSEVGEAAQQLWVSGEAREQNGRIRLAYRERVTEEMDAESDTDVVLHAREGLAMMKRSGVYATSMSFCEGEQRDCTYRTPYGDLAAVIAADSVKTETEPFGGAVRILYTISIQGADPSRRQICLTWRWQEN